MHFQHEIIGGVLRGAGSAIPLLFEARIAGFLVGFGARLSGGCTSGHGVCGLGRASPRSLVAVIVFMSVAMITTFILSAWL